MHSILPASYTKRVLQSILCLASLAGLASGQPLTNPYVFTMADSVVMDTSLVVGPWDGADPDRILVKDGHFAHEDGRPFRMVGTTVQYGGCFPDSAAAIAMANRLRALGINVVRFASFDYTGYWPISILADGKTTTENGLHPVSMTRFDWFTYQLRKRGIRYGFSFQSAWVPREADGVRQPDSTGFGARTVVIFDPVVQRIHRDIIRMLLTHVNPYTGLAYKDDAGLAFVMPFEDTQFMAYWAYTRDIVRNNPIGNFSMGLQHQRWIDSCFYSFLKGKGLSSDAALNAAWTMVPTNTQQQIRNGGFEDPFEQSWTLGVNTTDGAQALLQFSETDKVAGAQCGRIRIGSLGSNPSEGSVYLLQTLLNVERLHRYRVTINARTSAAKGTREVRCILYQNVYPYSSAGVDQHITLTGTWQKFTIDFTASSFEAGSVAMQLQCGGDTGDVYLDEISFTEIGAPGLRPGESLVNGTLRRDVYSDPSVTPARMKWNADFYLTYLTNLFETDRRMVRDTLKCAALLVPSNRLYSRFDHQAAMSYDFFANTDWRSSALSPLSDQYGSSIFNQVQFDYSTKPFVITHASIKHPLPYQHELGIVYPTYAGLHNWDGVFFSIFAQRGVAGAEKVDSNSTWEIFDKPSILTQLPVASNILRRIDIDTSAKVVQVAQAQELFSYPPFHAFIPFSLSVYSDSRMALFRRIEVLTELQDEESIVPHREISALSGNVVDPATLDAENGQTYFDATRNILRTIAPRYISVAGELKSDIVTEKDVIVEQLSGGEHVSVVLNSLTNDAVLESKSNLMVIGSRGQNRGITFDPNGNIDRWGGGPYEIEGCSMRITLKAPTFDSCRIVPLGPDARATDKGWSVGRSASGKFTIAVNTAQTSTPWYRVEFSNVISSVAGAPDVQFVVAPNPASDYVVVKASEPFSVVLYSMFGKQVATAEASEEARINTASLPVGVYIMQVDIGTASVTKSVLVVR